MDKNATKGHALKQISEIYNIPLDNILAIGDNLNDESMLKLVKYSVAMENAIPELKKYQDILLISQIQKVVLLIQ